MLTCAACRHDNPAGSAFCEECGGPFERRCPSCGSPYAPTAKFCRSCGASLAARAAEPAGDVVARKVITIVFADLVGSTSLHERLDPESVSRVMDRYYRTVRAPIEAHGGTVVQLLGDGVMCAFGVPRVAEDDAIRALRAAVAVQQAFRAFARQESDLVGSIGLRVAVNTGEVVVSDDHAAGIGDPLNVAARLQQEARDGDVLIGESTRRLVSELVTLEPVGALSLRGRAESVAAYRVVSLERPGAASATAFVGREDELRRVMAVHHAAVVDRRARLAVVLGSPGLGKSRLMDEVSRRLGDAATVLTVQCDAAGGATFAPIARTLRAHLGVDAGVSGDVLRAAIGGVAPGDDADRARIVDGIAGLLGGTPAAPEETFFVVRRFLAALAAKQPVVLAIDDLQWAEPLLLDLTEHLVQWSTDVPLLILVAARPELRETRSSLAVPGGLVAEVVTLAGLDAGAATRLAANLIGADQLPAAVAGRVLAASEGNPLFVGELVRMLVHDGSLRREGDRWTAGVELAALEMPPTIQALLAARIERLRPEERTVLERAAVVGRKFSRAAVTHLLPREVADLDARLEALRRSELIEPDSGWFLGEPALRFHHVLIRDAAYRRVLKNTRAELHARFADWLEGRGGEVVEHEETIGWHLEQAHQHLRELGPVDAQGRALGERAARYLAAAGRRALARDDLPLAASLLGRALDRLDADDPGRADLALDRCEALLAAGDVGPGARAIEEFGRFAGASDRLRAWHTCFAGQRAALTDPQALRATADAVSAAAEALALVGDAPGEAKAHSVHALALARLGKFGACEAALDRALAAARRGGDRRRSNAVLAGAPLAALWGPSPVTRASGRCLDVVRVLRITQGAPAVEAVALRCQGVLEALRGRTDAARRMIASSRRMVEELGITQRLLEADVFAGFVELLEGDAVAAEQTLRAAYDGLRNHGLGIDAAQAAALLGRALLALDRPEEAEALSHESEALAGDDLKAAIAWRGVRAEALARRGEHVAAIEFARAAVDIAAATDALLDHADARLALAVALRAAGRDDEAAAEEGRAVELSEAKGATLLAERARREDGRRPRVRTALEVARVAARPMRRGVPANAATLLFERFAVAWEVRDWGRVATCFASGFRMIDRQRMALLEVDRDRQLEALRSTFERMSRWSWEPLATRGERLALVRELLEHTGRVIGPAERECLVVAQVNAAGDYETAVVFDPDAVDAAYAELDERYAAGEAAPEELATKPHADRSENAATRSGERLDDAWRERNWERLAACFAPTYRESDRRKVALLDLEREPFLESLRAAFEMNVSGRTREVLATRGDRLALFRMRWEGAHGSVGPSEVEWLDLLEVDEHGDRIAGVMFDPDDLDAAYAELDERHELGDAEAALARFAELQPDPLRIPPNAASRVRDRMYEVFEARDWGALRAMIRADFTFHDCTKHSQVSGDVEVWIKSLEYIWSGRNVRIARELIGTAGDRIVLERTLTRSGREASPFEVEVIVLTEIDADQKVGTAVIWDLENRAAAFAEAHARFVAGEAASIGGQAPALALERAIAARDWETVRGVLSPDLVVHDHRPVGAGAMPRDEFVDWVRALTDMAPDAHREMLQMLAWNRHGGVNTSAIRGTVPEGGPFENILVRVNLTDGDRITSFENFDLADVVRALARFEELCAARERELTAAPVPSVVRAPAPAVQGRRRVRANAATENAARTDAAIAARDFDALTRLVAEESECIDHPTGTVYGRDGVLASWRKLAHIPSSTFRHEPLATLGDSVALLRLSVSATGVAQGRFDVGSYERDHLAVLEVDPRGRSTRAEVLAADRLGSAIALLYERYAERLPDGPARVRAAATARSIAALLGPIELDRHAAAIASDFVAVDHVALGLASARGAKQFLRGVRALRDLSGDTAVRIDDVLASREDALLVHWTNVGIDRRSGGAYERPRLVIWKFDAEGLLCHWEQFEPERDGEALARFDALLAEPFVRPHRERRHPGGRPRPRAARRDAGALRGARRERAVRPTARG